MHGQTFQVSQKLRMWTTTQKLNISSDKYNSFISFTVIYFPLFLLELKYHAGQILYKQESIVKP